MLKVINIIKKLCKKISDWIKGNSGVCMLCICVLVIIVYLLYNGLLKLELSSVLETFKISVTVLISMLGFSVSIYVFLNNALQSRKSNIVIEKEIIEEFQKQKRDKLNKRIIFAVAAVLIEGFVIALEEPIDEYIVSKPELSGKMLCLVLILICIIVTAANIIELGYFTFGVINYENGLERLVGEESASDKYKNKSADDSMSKGVFLNIANNLEVISDRLIENHLHAKSSDSDESNLKRAICDGITDPPEICNRGEFAENYNQVMSYRNLLLQDHKTKDSDQVHMGDQVQNILNQLFQNYLKNELVTGVSLSNIQVTDVDLSKTSFSNSFLQNITFKGESKLNSTDFRNSTLNTVDFGKADCDSINFKDSKLINVNFSTDMNLERAVFTDADLTGLDQLGASDKEGNPLSLKNTNFDRTNMTHLDIYNTSFEFASMRNVRLVDSQIGATAQKDDNTVFNHADLTQADMLRCKIERCDFSNADLDEATLTYTKMKDVSMEECRLRGTGMSMSELTSCKFNKAYASDLSLKGSKATKCDFSYATLANADMSGATFEEVCFDDAVCTKTLWVDSTIKDCSFERCMLVNVKIAGKTKENARVYKCNFKFANFSESAITNVDFDECDFECADFTGIRLINVRFINCKNMDTVLTKAVWLAYVEYLGNQRTELQEMENVKGKPDSGSWRYKYSSMVHPEEPVIVYD